MLDDFRGATKPIGEEEGEMLRQVRVRIEGKLRERRKGVFIYTCTIFTFMPFLRK